MSRRLKKESVSADANEYRTSNSPLIMVRWLINLYLIVIVMVFPFVISPGYTRTSYLKFGLLMSATYGIQLYGIIIPTFIPLSALLIIIGTVIYIKDTGSSTADFIRRIKLSKVDIFVLLYLLVLAISSLVSPYKDELLIGYETWNMGLATQFMFIYLYLVMSRFFDIYDTELLIYASLASSGMVFLIGILQRLGFDIFSLYIALPLELFNRFLSTIGQVSWFSSYLMVFLPISLFLVWHEERSAVLWKVSLIHLVISSMALVMQDMDSGFFTIFMVLSVLFTVSWGDMSRILRALESCLIILLSFRLAGLLQMIFRDRMTWIDPLSLYVSQGALIWAVIAVLAIVYGVLRYAGDHGMDKGRESVKVIPGIYWTMILILGAGMIIYIVLNTTGRLPEALRSTNRYLVFDPMWGNVRGAIWHDAACSYIAEIRNDPVHALLGVGADQFYHVIQDYVHDQTIMCEPNVVLTNAHNEILTAIINYGLLGGVIYAGIFAGSIVRYMKTKKECIYSICTLLCVTAYVSHNVFCYQQFIATTYIFIIMGIGEQYIRNKYSKNP